MGKQKKFMLMAVSLFAVMLVGAVCLCYLPGAPLHGFESWMYGRIGDDLFSYYTAQLSLTFITISVMTVLSEKNVIIYWENIAESRLIKPTFGCFAAFSWYSIISNIGAAIGVFLKSCTVFSLFFMANILVLILLTNAIIDVYYGKDTKKKKLMQELAKDYAAHLQREEEGMDPYLEKIYGLSYRTRQLSREENLLELQEIYELYWQQYPLFDDMSAKPFTEALALSLSTHTSHLFVDMLERVARKEAQRVEGVVAACKGLQTGEADGLTREEIARILPDLTGSGFQENAYREMLLAYYEMHFPFRDCEIWMAFDKTQAITRWVREVNITDAHDPAYTDFIRLVKYRLVSLYNFHVCTECLRLERPDFIPLMLVNIRPNGSVEWALEGGSPDYQQLTVFAEAAFSSSARGVSDDTDLYVMWHVLRDFYAASRDNPDVGLFRGEYGDFPITEVMLRWALSKEETQLLQDLMWHKA